MSKEVLVTSQGMLGRYLDTGFSSRGLSVDVTTSELDQVLPKDGIYHLEATDAESIERLVSSGYKSIINMMGIANPKVAKENPQLTDAINHLSVIKILEAVKKLPQAKRPVVILACSVLQFDIKESGVVTVNHPLKDTTDPYISSKNKMFTSALPFLKDGLDIRFAFIANTTGEGHPGGYFPTEMADQILRGEVVRHGPIDDVKRPFLHGKDAANIFFYGLTKLSSGDRFLVAGSESTRLRDFLTSMIEASGKKDVETVEDPNLGTSTQIKDLSFDIENIKRMGYKQENGIPDICSTVLKDRARVLKGLSLPLRGVRGF